MDVIVWHNPKCSKSRQTLALLEEKNVDIKVKLYLQDPPTQAELQQMQQALGCKAIEMMRPKETQFKALKLDASMPDAKLQSAMLEHPILIERPIVLVGKKAAIGRPPEQVLALF